MNRRLFLAGIGAAALCPVCARLALATDATQHAHWSYYGAEGPLHWADLDPANARCSTGHNQSPIDITHATHENLPPIKTDWKRGGTMVDNGHSIQINVEPGSKTLVGSTEYDLVQYHFHSPSEHHVDGKIYAMEMHLVHKKPDGALGVIGIFLTPGKTSAAFETLASKFPQNVGNEVQILDVDPTDFLPSSRKYYAYSGSLTTPPCSESVDWMVFSEPSEVAAKDIAAFVKLFPNNARPVRAVNRRPIHGSS